VQIKLTVLQEPAQMIYDVPSPHIVVANIGENLPKLMDIWRILGKEDFRSLSIVEYCSQRLIEFMRY